MYKKNDKRKVYQIIDMYIAGKIDATVFSDEFYYSYDLELNKSNLSKTELEIFKEISNVSTFFSPFEDDINEYDIFYSEEELKKFIIEIRKKLQKCIPKNYSLHYREHSKFKKYDIIKLIIKIPNKDIKLGAFGIVDESQEENSDMLRILFFKDDGSNYEPMYVPMDYVNIDN